MINISKAVQEVWEECSLSCGGGIQRKKGMKNETRMCNLMNCPGKKTAQNRKRFNKEKLFSIYSCFSMFGGVKKHLVS